MKYKILILSYLIFLSSSNCTQKGARLISKKVDNTEAAIEIIDATCQGNDWAYISGRFAQIKAPVAFYRFGEGISITVNNFKTFFSCFNKHDGGCGFSCPMDPQGSCETNSEGPSSLCYGSYVDGYFEYKAYPLLFTSAIAVTTYKSIFSQRAAMSPFDTSIYRTIHHTEEVMTDPNLIDETALLSGIAGSDELKEQYYYIPTLNRVLTSAGLESLRDKPTISLNQAGLDCRTTFPKISLQANEVAETPFHWIVVHPKETKNGDLKIYSAQDFVTKDIRFLTSVGIKSSMIEMADIVWDPCHQGHFTLKVSAIGVNIFFTIGVDALWPHDTICLIMQETPTSDYSLLQYNKEEQYFETSDNWAGLVSTDIIGKYTIRFTQPASTNTLVPPDSEVTISLDFSEKAEVTVKSEKTAKCTIIFKETPECIKEVSVSNKPSEKILLASCLPLNPVTYYTCGPSSGLIINPDYLAVKLISNLQSGSYTEGKSPSLQKKSDQDQRRRLQDYFIDFSVNANIYRAILVVISIVMALFLIIITRYLFRRFQVRQNNRKVKAQLQALDWKSI